jgi:hypothetical protein
MDEHLIDKRVIERQIRKGKLDEKAHRRSLATLPDSSDRVARSAPEAPMASAPSASVASSPFAAAAAASPALGAEPMLSEADDDDDVDDEDDDDEDDDEAEDDAPADASI